MLTGAVISFCVPNIDSLNHTNQSANLNFLYFTNTLYAILGNKIVHLFNKYFLKTEPNCKKFFFLKCLVNYYLSQ